MHLSNDARNKVHRRANKAFHKVGGQGGSVMSVVLCLLCLKYSELDPFVEVNRTITSHPLHSTFDEQQLSFFYQLCPNSLTIPLRTPQFVYKIFLFNKHKILQIEICLLK